MTAKYFAILTNQGAARLANAAALGTKLNLTQMAVGDANGTLPTPDPAQTKLINQKRIAPLNLLTVDPANTSQIIAEQIIPENEGGFWIREIGLYDDDGILIAVANCPETYKPQLQEGSGRTQTIRMILIVSSTSAITLKIDPAVVLATRQYVDDKIIEVKGYADDLMKKHVEAANPHKQYPLIANALKEMVDAGLAGDVLKNLGLVNNGAVGRLIGMQIIKTSGTYTKTPGAMFADVIAIGGGGGGGWATSTANYNAAGGGGGGGGMARGLFNLSAISTVLVTIGAGGNGGIASTITNATHGGTTTFGSYLSAGGGQPGNGCTASGSSASCGMGGQGGTSTVGALLCNGYAGLPGVMATPTAVGGTVGSGLGGGSFISGPGGYGAGGNGAATSGGAQNVNGNPGNAGVIIILEYA